MILQIHVRTQVLKGDSMPIEENEQDNMDIIGDWTMVAEELDMAALLKLEIGGKRKKIQSKWNL